MSDISHEQVQLAYSKVQEKYKFPEELKELQKQAILHLLNRRNILCVLPTGFGKSLIFTLLPLLLDEVSLFPEVYQTYYTVNTPL
jgi:superfamily II DNA helicase RecQ